MLGKKSRPIIGKLSELLVSGNKRKFLNPRIPSDFKSSSPRSSKRYDVGGVGLGIVAALEKSTFTDCCNHAICSSNLNRSNAIVVNVVNSGKDYDKFRGRIDDLGIEILEEDYTYVISHGPGKSSTKIYYNGYEQRKNSNGFDDVKETPEARFAEDVVYPTSDFLSSCHLCRKKLHGKDIYMYRGEKGFCSSECRSTQIMMDERKEHCRAEASRSAKVSTSPYNNNNNNRGQIFSTGILAI